MRKINTGILTVFFMILPFALLFGAAFDPASIKKDPKFFYGFGTGATAQEAQQLALNDLIADALTGSRTAKVDGDTRVVITTEMSQAFKLDNIRPFINQKDKGTYAAGYRISQKDWAKLEAPHEAAVRADIVAQFKSISGNKNKALQDRMADAGTLLVRLANEGLYDALSDSNGGSTLLSKTIEKFYTNLVAGLKVSITPESGLIHSGTTFAVSIVGKDGKALAQLPVSLTWRSAKKEAAALAAETDDQGKLTVASPTDANLQNRSVWLKISTTFALKVPESRFLAELDKSLQQEFPYRQLEEMAKMTENEILVAGGPFMAGAVKHDRRASVNKEKLRKVTIKSFAIDRYPVTNAMYGAYLDDAKVPQSDYPEYWDNAGFNKPNQPVIGVSWEEANKFAAWLSSRIGYTKRLPTEDEYEMAARGDQPIIYPWGDNAATDGVRANYNGNKRFDSTSPVGSFENGKNSLGIFDLSGNVWEWTSSSPDSNMSDDPSNKIVKGGSWMDGPSELRISNRRSLDPTQRYQDTGFRLVREVTQ